MRARANPLWIPRIDFSTPLLLPRYFVSLPSNKLELWFALEARRFRDPVFRELFSEKKVVAEERRLRIDSSPMGRYQQQFSLAALGNNYRRPVIGADLVLTRRCRLLLSFQAQLTWPLLSS